MGDGGKLKQYYVIEISGIIKYIFMELYVVIVAGGSGKRMGAEIPKQFLELAGRPVLMHTIERFKTFNQSIEIITVLPENQLRHWIELQNQYSFTVPQTLVKGGSHRFYLCKKRT